MGDPFQVKGEDLANASTSVFRLEFRSFNEFAFVMCTGKKTTHSMSPACSFLGHSQPHSLSPRLRWMISKKPPAQLSSTSSTHRLRGCRSQTTKAIKQKIPPTVSCAAFQIDIYSQQEHVQVMHAADGACLAFSSLCLIESLLA